MNDFSALNLAKPLLRAVQDMGYTTPTPIQAKAIPPLLEGRDLIGIAQTGTGKTAAFVLPLLQYLQTKTEPLMRRTTRALVLAPTRELAIQIGESFAVHARHAGLRHAVVFGGVSINGQIRACSGGVDALIATPGRLLDMMAQGHVRLDRVKFFILDEADRMLDMGFIRDVKKIVAVLPVERQTALFSATMPDSVRALTGSLLRRPIQVEVAPQATTVERVEQSVIFVDRDKKRALLSKMLVDPGISRVLIFTRTKHGADRVAEHLEKGGIDADAIHGNKNQNARQKALEGFRSGRIRALVATDIAARGIDVDGVTHVINFDLPNEPESYVHRIGRTARAGAAGIAISFCDGEERAYLRDIEKVIRGRIPVIGNDPFAKAARGPDRPRTEPAPAAKPARPKRAPMAAKHSSGDDVRRGRPSFAAARVA